MGMLAALAGLLARRRWGMALSLFAAGIAVVMVAGCPASGHHHFGLWWVGEMACMGGWAALSLAGLRSPARGQA
jgi:peptidoglycan/LPS O-acetylase OafA/YrhL